MSGIKGKSGRKSRYHEIRIAELCDLSVNWAIDNWKGLPHEDKMRIVTTLASKAIPIQLQHSGDALQPITMVWREHGKDIGPTPESMEGVEGQKQV